MIYLESFSIPDVVEEEQFLNSSSHRFCTQQYYPFKVFDSPLPTLQMQNITILYGGNGSGKITLLNLMAEKLKLPRSSPYNRTPLFDVYADMCSLELAGQRSGYPDRFPMRAALSAVMMCLSISSTCESRMTRSIWQPSAQPASGDPKILSVCGSTPGNRVGSMRS